MTFHSGIKRAVSLVLVFCLVPFGQISFAQAQPQEANNSSQYLLPLPQDLKDLKVPSEIGRVETVFQGSPKGPVVFLVQDAHAIPEAQENIRRLLAHFQDTYGTSLTALEGVVSRLDPQMLRSYPEKESLKNVFNDFGEKAELAGPSAAAVLNEKGADYVGLEERSAYDEGLACFLAAQKEKTKLEPLLTEKEKELEKKKGGVYSPELLKVDEALRSFKENRTPLLEVLKILQASREPDPGTQIALVLERAAMEGKDRSGSDSRLRLFALKVQRYWEGQPPDASAKANLKKFHENFQLFETSQITPQAFALVLHELTAGTLLENGLPEEFHPGLWAERKLKQLEGSQFFKEFEAYAAAVKEKLFRGEEERELDLESVRLELVRKWMTLELGFEDWEKIRSSRDVFEKGFEEGAFRPQAAFYENAESRDEIMMRNLQKLMDRRRPASLAVVAGGFHTAGLTKLLREQGVSFAVLAPEISAIPETIAYEKQMSGDVSWKNYFRIENGQVNLHDAFLRGVRDQLLDTVQNKAGAEPEAGNLLLKRWRDQILRDLASQGRIEEASEYTRFLDEVSAGKNLEKSAGLQRVERFIEQLKSLEKSGSLNEQTIAQLLRPSSRPVDAVQGALEPGARLGGALIDIRLGAQGLVLTPSAEALKKMSRDGAARSELRSEDPYQQFEALRDSFYKTLKDASVKAKGADPSAYLPDLQALAWVLRGDVPQGENVEELQKLILDSGNFRALGVAYPAMGIYASDIVEHLSHQAELGKPEAVYALAEVFRSASWALTEENKTQLVQSLIALAKQGQLEAARYLGEFYEYSPMVLSNYLQSEIGKAMESDEGFTGLAYSLAGASGEKSQDLKEALEVLNEISENSPFFFRQIARLFPALQDTDPQSATAIYLALADEAYNQQAEGPGREAAILGLAELYTQMDSSLQSFARRADIASMLQDALTHESEGIRQTAQIAISMIWALRPSSSGEFPDTAPAKVQPADVLVSRKTFVQKFESAYRNQIMAKAKAGDLLAIEALGYIYPTASELMQKDILELLKSKLSNNTAEGNAAVHAYGILFEFLDMDLMANIYGAVKNWAKDFQQGAFLGLIYMAEFYHKVPFGHYNVTEIQKMVNQASDSNDPGSLAALGALTQMVGGPGDIASVYAKLMESQESGAVLGLAELYSALEKDQQDAAYSQILNLFILELPGAGQALAAIGQNLGSEPAQEYRFKEIVQALLNGYSDGNPEAVKALALLYGALPAESPALGAILEIIMAQAENGSSAGLLSAAIIVDDVAAELNKMAAGKSLSKHEFMPSKPLTLSSPSSAAPVAQEEPLPDEIIKAFQSVIAKQDSEPPPGMDHIWYQIMLSSFPALPADKQTQILKKLKAAGEPLGSSWPIDLSSILSVFSFAKPEYNPYLISMAQAYKEAVTPEHKAIVKNFPAVILKAARKRIPGGYVALGILAQTMDPEAEDYQEAVELLFKEAEALNLSGAPKTDAAQVISALWGLAHIQYTFDPTLHKRLEGLVKKASFFFPELKVWLEAVLYLHTESGASAASPEGAAAYQALAAQIKTGDLTDNLAILPALAQGMAMSDDEALNENIRKDLLQLAREGGSQMAYHYIAAIYYHLTPAEKTEFFKILVDKISTPGDPAGLAAFNALGLIAREARSDSLAAEQNQEMPLIQNAALMALGIKSLNQPAAEILTELTSDTVQNQIVPKLLNMASQSSQPYTAAATSGLGKLAGKISPNLVPAVFETLKHKLNPYHEDIEDRRAAVSAVISLYPHLDPQLQHLANQYLLQFVAATGTEFFIEGGRAALFLSKFVPSSAPKVLDFKNALLLHLENENPNPEAFEAAAFLSSGAPEILDPKIVKKVLLKAPDAQMMKGLAYLLLGNHIPIENDRDTVFEKAFQNLQANPSDPGALKTISILMDSYGGSYGVSQNQFFRAAQLLTTIASAQPEALAILAQAYSYLTPEIRTNLLQAIAVNIASNNPVVLVAAGHLSIFENLLPDPVKPAPAAPMDAGIDFEAMDQSQKVYKRFLDELSAVEKVGGADAVSADAVHFAKSWAFDLLPEAEQSQWSGKVVAAVTGGIANSEFSAPKDFPYFAMLLAAGALNPAQSEAVFNYLDTFGDEAGYYEGLGTMLAQWPAQVPGAWYTQMRQRALSTLDEQFELKNPGAVRGMAIALPGLTPAERAAVIEDLFEQAEIYHDPFLKAKIYPYLSEDLRTSLRDEFVGAMENNPSAVEGVLGYALPALLSDDLAEGSLIIGLLFNRLSAASSSAAAAESLARAFGVLSPLQKKELVKQISGFPAPVRLRLLAVIVKESFNLGLLSATVDSNVPPAALGGILNMDPEKANSHDFWSELAQDASSNLLNPPSQGESASKIKVVWNSGEPAPMQFPWVTASIGAEKPAAYYEFDPRQQVVSETSYSLTRTGSPGQSNAAARKLMTDFEAFEDLNAEVISLLMKQDKTVADMRLLFSAMERMVKAYLVLFKKQNPDWSIDAIAKSSADLSGGRAIAKLFLSIREETENALAIMQPSAKDSDLLDPFINKMIQELDARSSANLIITPAEQTEVNHPALIKGVTYAEYRQYQQQIQAGIAKETAHYDAIKGTSFHELVNIVHQKGVRNLSTLFPQDGSGAQGAVQIAQKGPGGALGSVLDVPFAYLDARSAPDINHPLPVRLAAMALAKGQLVHRNSLLFPVKNAVILSTENRALINLPLGVHSARIQLALAPVQETGRLFINYTDSGAYYAPGSNIRIDALAAAFTAAGFKVRKVGYTLDASFDKDSGASSLGELIEKLELAIQALTSTKDLDLRINETPALKTDVQQGTAILAEHFREDGFLIRDAGVNFMLQAPRPDVSHWRTLAKEFKIPEEGNGQRLLDRVSRRLQQASDRSEAAYSQSGSLGVSTAFEEDSLRSPVETLLQNLFPGQLSDGLSLDARRIAAIAMMIRPFAEHRVLASVGGYEVERIVIPLLYEDLTIDLLKDSEGQAYYGGAAYLGRFFSRGKTYDRARGVTLQSNRLDAQGLEELLKLQGFSQTSAGRDLLKQRGVEVLDGQPLLDAATASEEAVDRVTQVSMAFDPEKLFEKTAARHAVSPLSIGGLAVQPGKTLAVARFKREGRAPEDFRGALWIGESADNTDDPHLFASLGIVMTTGGVQSHGSVRAGENRKPGSIFNTARITPEGLSFEGYSDYASETQIQFQGRTLSYYELKAGNQKTHTVREGDLVYLDAREGVLYVIAEAGEAGGKTLADFQAFLEWKNQSGYEAARKGKEAAERPVIDLAPLEKLFKTLNSESLFRAILDELLDSNLLSPESLSRLMEALEDRKDLQRIVKNFLRNRAGDEVDQFERSLDELLQRMKQPLSQSPAGLDSLYLEVERFMSRADSLQGMIALANGSWQGRITAKEIEEGKASVRETALRQIRVYLQALFYGMREFLASAAQFPAHELSMLLGYRSLILRAGAVSASGQILKSMGLTGDLRKLDSRIVALREERENQVKALQGLGILWKSDLKDRFSRPLAGGKGSNSAETLHAIEFLKSQNKIPAGFQVEAPQGFAIQPGEYERWRKTEGDLDGDLKKTLALAYRDLTIRQMESVLKLIEADDRTAPGLKEDLEKKILLPALKSLRGAEDPYVIDGVVSLLRNFIFLYLSNQPAQAVSISLANRLRVLGAVAVRSSGLKEDSEEEAMAGMKETKLNVTGTEDLFASVREVWASGAESILIDEMINPKASGTAFSADIASRDLSVVRIEAAHGLAKGLVDQTVKDPDFFTISKPGAKGQPYQFQKEHIGLKQEKVVLDFESGGYAVVDNDAALRGQSSLTRDQQLAVAEVVDGLSAYFGYPVDVEFSIDADNRIIPLQVRPITTLREALKRGQDALRSELRSEEGDEAYRFIAAPNDFGKTAGFTAKTYAKYVSKGVTEFYFKKTRAYPFEDIGRFQVGSLTFRMVRFPEALQAEREGSTSGGVAVGAASPKYLLEVYLANEKGAGKWRALEDVEIRDGQPLFIYRSKTSHVSLPGLFDLFLNKSEQFEAASQLDEAGQIGQSRAAIVISWKDENGLVRNYYLPNTISPEKPETISEVTRISRSAADDPDAGDRITIDLDKAEAARAPDAPKGWLPHRMQDFVRPGHLMLMTDVLDGQDFVILQNQGSTNGFHVEERQVPSPRKQPPKEPLSQDEQSLADDQKASEILESVAPEHSLVLQPRNFVEGQEGKLQFFYDGPFRVDYGADPQIAFYVTGGVLHLQAEGHRTRIIQQNRVNVELGEQRFEVHYVNGRITVTNHNPDEASQIWVLKGGLPRSELRAMNEDEYFPAPVPQADETALTPAVPQTPKPAGLLARIGSVIRKGVDRVKFNAAMRDVRRKSGDVDLHWFNDHAERGAEFSLSVLEAMLQPGTYAQLDRRARQHLAYFLLSSRLPEGYEPYVRQRLGRLDAEGVAAAFMINNGSEEIVPNILRYNTPEGNELVRQLLKHHNPSVRRLVFSHLLNGSAAHLGSSSEILRESRFLGDGLSLQEVLDKFSETEDEGFYAYIPKPSLVDLRRIAGLPFEVNLFVFGDHLVIIKGGDSSVTAMFPGKKTSSSDMHNHPDGNIFPSGYQRRAGGYGSEEYRGDLMNVGTEGFHLIATRHGIIRYYRETREGIKGKPGEIRVTLPDKSEIDFKADVTGEGGSARYYFNENSRELLDAAGRVRDFRATGLLGPSGQIFALQFISWRSLAGSFLAGGKQEAFGRFIPSAFLDAAALKPGQSTEFEDFFKDQIPIDQTGRERLKGYENAAVSPASPAEASYDKVAVSASTELARYQPPASETGAGSALQIVLPALDKIEVQLQTLLASNYPAAIAFADRYLSPLQPPEVKQAVFRGLANGAEWLLPADTNRYLKQGFEDYDNRVNETALDLLAKASPEADVFGALSLAFSRHIAVTRLVRMTGTLNMSPENKTGMFLLYTKDSATYRNVLSQSFSRDLFGYAPQVLFYSLVQANLPSEMNERILTEAYQNLTNFEMQGLEGNGGTGHVRLIPRLNLSDEALGRLAGLLIRLGRPDSAQLYADRLTKPMTLVEGESAQVLEARDKRTEFLRKLEDAAPALRKKELLDWAKSWASRYGSVAKSEYQKAYAIEEEFESVLEGLSRWELGEDFNSQILQTLLPGIPRPRGDRAALVSQAGGLLARIPLSSGEMIRFYRLLMAQDMNFFKGRPAAAIQGIGETPYLTKTEKKELLEAAFSSPEIADDRWVGDILENQQSRPIYQRELNLEAALEALLDTGLSANEDSELIGRIPMFQGLEYRSVRQAMANLGIAADGAFDFMEALKTRHPEYFSKMKKYSAEKTRQALQQHAAALKDARTPAALPAVQDQPEPPPGTRSELRANFSLEEKTVLSMVSEWLRSAAAAKPGSGSVVSGFDQLLAGMRVFSDAEIFARFTGLIYRLRSAYPELALPQEIESAGLGQYALDSLLSNHRPTQFLGAHGIAYLGPALELELSAVYGLREELLTQLQSLASKRDGKDRSVMAAMLELGVPLNKIRAFGAFSSSLEDTTESAEGHLLGAFNYAQLPLIEDAALLNPNGRSLRAMNRREWYKLILSTERTGRIQQQLLRLRTPAHHYEAILQLARYRFLAPQAVAEILELSHSQAPPYPNARLHLLGLLSLAGPGAVEGGLDEAISVLADPDSNLRMIEAALQMIYGMGPAGIKASKEVLRILQIRKEDEAEGVRFLAAMTLAATGSTSETVLNALDEAAQKDPLESVRYFSKNAMESLMALREEQGEGSGGSARSELRAAFTREQKEVLGLVGDSLRASLAAQPGSEEIRASLERLLAGLETFPDTEIFARMTVLLDRIRNAYPAMALPQEFEETGLGLYARSLLDSEYRPNALLAALGIAYMGPALSYEFANDSRLRGELLQGLDRWIASSGGEIDRRFVMAKIALGVPARDAFTGGRFTGADENLFGIAPMTAADYLRFFQRPDRFATVQNILTRFAAEPGNFGIHLELAPYRFLASSVIPTAVRFLQQPEAYPAAHQHIIELIGQQGAGGIDQALDELLRILQNPQNNPSLLGSVLKTLTMAGPAASRAAPAVLALLTGGAVLDESLTVGAVETLGSLGNTSSNILTALSRFSQDTGRSESVRQAADRALDSLDVLSAERGEARSELRAAFTEDQKAVIGMIADSLNVSLAAQTGSEEIRASLQRLLAGLETFPDTEIFARMTVLLDRIRTAYPQVTLPTELEDAGLGLYARRLLDSKYLPNALLAALGIAYMGPELSFEFANESRLRGELLQRIESWAEAEGGQMRDRRFILAMIALGAPRSAAEKSGGFSGASEEFISNAESPIRALFPYMLHLADNFPGLDPLPIRDHEYLDLALNSNRHSFVQADIRNLIFPENRYPVLLSLMRFRFFAYSAVPELIRLIQENSEPYNGAYGHLMLMIGLQGAGGVDGGMDTLIRALQNPESSTEDLRAALDSLTIMGPAAVRAAPEVLKLLTREDHPLSDSNIADAITALDSLGSTSQEILDELSSLSQHGNTANIRQTASAAYGRLSILAAERGETRSELRAAAIAPAQQSIQSTDRSELRDIARQLAEGLVSDSFDLIESEKVAAGVAQAVKTSGVEDLAAELRLEALRSAAQKSDPTQQTVIKLDSRLAAFSVQWFVDALSVLQDEKLGAAFDVPGEEIALGRVLDENPSLKGRFETLLVSKSMDLSLMKTEGIPIETLGDPVNYRARYSLANGQSLPVISASGTAARLQNNKNAFAVALSGESGTDDGFENAALAAMLSGALLTSHFSGSAERLKKNPGDRAEILKKVWAALLKSGQYDGPSFLQMGEDGVLSVDRANLQRFITEFLARQAIQSAA